MAFSITGSTSKAGSTVNYSGAAAGSVTADGAGLFTISGLANGVYQVAPATLGFVAVPIHQIVTISGGNVSGINFTATAVYSEKDSRTSVNAEVDVQGTDTYTVQTASNHNLPVDSRVAGQPIDSRVIGNIPVNDRTAGG
jgi:hypothetical protein